MKTEPNNPMYPTMEHGFDNTGLPTVRTELGMTIRQHFAVIALQGLVAGVRYYNLRDVNEDVLAEKAVKLADALGNALNRMPTK